MSESLSVDKRECRTSLPRCFNRKYSSLSILWARLIQADESLARTAGQVEAFCHMLRQRQGYRLRG